MKSALLAFVLVTALCGLCQCQNIQLPSDKELDELLDDPKRVTEVVDCVISFNPATCDPRLKDAYELAPEYFATSGTCRSCTEDVLLRVRKFLMRLQRKYRTEYMRLINSVAS